MKLEVGRYYINSDGTRIHTIEALKPFGEPHFAVEGKEKGGAKMIGFIQDVEKDVDAFWTEIGKEEFDAA